MRQSDEPEMRTLSSYWRHKTDPPCPLSVLAHWLSLRSQMRIVRSRCEYKTKVSRQDVCDVGMERRTEPEMTLCWSNCKQ